MLFLFTNTSLSLRCFKKKNVKELVLEYANNKKAGKNSSLFGGCLRSFKQKMISKCNNTVVLLMDKCIAHHSYDILPTFSNVELVYLPPNTTSKLQPLGAGITATRCEDVIQTTSFGTCFGFSGCRH